MTKGVTLISVVDGFDATKPEGRILLGMLAVIAEYERELIVERTKAGIAAARQRGARIGRPTVVNREVNRSVSEMTELGSSIPEISRLLKNFRTLSF